MATRRGVNAGRGGSPRGKPKLGQNFLKDESTARKIVDALGDLSATTTIEIGPGRGVLTHLLAARASRLIAVELDEMLATSLKAAFSLQPAVEIANANILHVELAGLLRNGEKAKVVGNIPYYITSDILLRLFAQHESIDTVVLMVQKEVADRLAAEPGTRDYGLLTVTAQLYCEVERLFHLPPGAFSPPPKVWSSVVRLRMRPRAQELGVDEKEFLHFCRLAFAQKRKTLFNNLRGRYAEEPLRAALQAEHAENARAEELALERLASMFLVLAHSALRHSSRSEE